jgi:hypothetical protein
LAETGAATAGVDSGNDDFLQWLIGGRLIAARLSMNRTIAPEQSHGDCRSDQRRPCDSHDLPTPDVVVSCCTSGLAR